MSALFESLESRSLLSAGYNIDLVDATAMRGGGINSMITRERGHSGGLAYAPLTGMVTHATIPNIRRTYSGSFSLGTLTGTFKMVVRKEDNRGTFAALRGTLDINTNLYGAIHGDMTYGKIRDNDRINMTFTGTNPAFTEVITGKSNTTGSQLKGHLDFTGSFTFAVDFTLSKVVTS